jgi:hypothetical protein
VFNANCYFFTGSVGNTNVLDYYTEQRRADYGLGLLSVAYINELILLLELLHIDDTSGMYDDDGELNPKLNELTRKNCF